MRAVRIAALAAGVIAAGLAGGCRSAAPAVPPACAALDAMADGRTDAAGSIAACLGALPPGGAVRLRPGRYLLRSPLRVTAPVTIASRGLAPADPGCGVDGDARCATFAFRPPPGSGQSLLQVAGDDIAFDHVAFEGPRRADPAAARAACAVDARKPAGGGLRASGDRLRFTRSAFHDFACYTALEYHAGTGSVFRDDVFAGNGTHDAARSWSDGLTIHDGRGLVVTGNRFVDNTDVQLIFGGCQGCTIAGNVFRHTGTATGGAFAEVMLHAWPNGSTSGDFTGTTVTGNDVDCGAARRCGFGLMIGAKPWYPAPTFGGAARGNRIARARIGINVDELTGPMTVADNTVVASGGPTGAACGPRVAAAVNVSPASRPHLRGDTAADGAADYAGCILNFPAG